MIQKRFIYTSISLITFIGLQCDACSKHKIKENKLKEYKEICNSNAFENGVQAIFWPLTFSNTMIPYILSSENKKD